MDKGHSLQDKKLYAQLSALFRQCRHPAEFRIQKMAISENIDELLMPAIEVAKSCADPVPEAGHPGSSADLNHIRFINDLATGLWRLRKRIFDEETGEPKSEMKKLYRHFEATWDVLMNAGVEIQDHTGEAYDSGL